MKSRVRACSFVAAVFLLPALASSPLQAQTLRYTYDALGRLTFVEDGVNGNRDYDYDAAGNRRYVSAGAANDASSEAAPPSPPAEPSYLQCSTTAPGVYRASWRSVPGAAFYVVRDRDGNEYTVTGTSQYIDGASCYWVKACATEVLCSSKVYF